MYGNNELLNIQKLIELGAKAYTPDQLEKLRTHEPRIWYDHLVSIVDRIFGMESPIGAQVHGEYIDFLGQDGNWLERSEQLENAVYGYLYSVKMHLADSEPYVAWIAWYLLHYARKDQKRLVGRHFRSLLQSMEYTDDIVLYPIDRISTPDDDKRDIPHPLDAPDIGRRCLIILELAELGSVDHARRHLLSISADYRHYRKDKSLEFRGITAMAEAIALYLHNYDTPDTTYTEKVLAKIAASIAFFEKSAGQNPSRQMGWIAKTNCAGIKRLGAQLLIKLNRGQEAQAYCQSAITLLQEILDVVPSLAKSDNSLSVEMRTRMAMLKELESQAQQGKQ